jgi:hypothetical protein
MFYAYYETPTDRRIGIILTGRPEVHVIYGPSRMAEGWQWPTERLWFVQRGTAVIAVMAFSYDDAWMQADSAFVAASSEECLLPSITPLSASPTPAGTEPASSE